MSEIQAEEGDKRFLDQPRWVGGTAIGLGGVGAVVAAIASNAQYRDRHSDHFDASAEYGGGLKELRAERTGLQQLVSSVERVPERIDDDLVDMLVSAAEEELVIVNTDIANTESLIGEAPPDEFLELTAKTFGGVVIGYLAPVLIYGGARSMLKRRAARKLRNSSIE